MTYTPLIETASGSGKFEMLPKDIKAASTRDALSQAAQFVTDGRKIGVFPHRSVAGGPVSNAAEPDEAGQKYSALAQIGGVNAFFTPFDQTPASTQIDASQIAMALGQVYGFRIGLMALQEDQEGQGSVTPETDTASDESATADKKGK
ncbi:hypothetical protein N5W20_07260 [Candidatus Kirkpatrickella diaphorinae]|uniref:Uncharacterized protein n=1 Tax=Candidatus Kirkpatrickella diaphorinae TaxID=2984322 RepID=A0ABY6GHA0_9PROT|nr:hypothetical protein [Candidatus Kirkpatrickella diaphorinae]UYH50899.1 hypothetical protein N5W20_07260 [Candidatus Kirkpatrickella diaphorinae]